MQIAGNIPDIKPRIYGNKLMEIRENPVVIAEIKHRIWGQLNGDQGTTPYFDIAEIKQRICGNFSKSCRRSSEWFDSAEQPGNNSKIAAVQQAGLRRSRAKRSWPKK